MHDYKRKIMRPAIYERDLGKLTFSEENLLWVMATCSMIELSCLRKALARLSNLTNKRFNLRLW